MKERVFKIIWQEFIYGGHLQSLGAAAIVFVSGFLLRIPLSWQVLLISYLIFYLLYLYNRFREIESDYLTNPERTAHLKRYIKFMPLIFCLVISFLFLLLVYFANIKALVFGLLLLFFGLLYTVIFKRFTQKVALFKNFYVAAFFALLVFFPVLYSNYPLSEKLTAGVLILMTFVYLRAFVMQVFLDVKDTIADKKEGLLTFSGLLGEEKTFRFLKIMAVVSILPILLSSPLFFNVFPAYILMLLLTVLYSFYCFALGQKKEYSGYVLAGGEFISWPILLLIGKVLL